MKYTKAITFTLLVTLTLIGLQTNAAGKTEKTEPQVIQAVATPSKVDKKSTEDENYFGIFQLGFFAPLQIMPEDYAIYGLKLGTIYSCNRELAGLDLGLCNETTETHYGVSCAILSRRQGNVYGLNVAGIMNLSKANETGFSLSGLYNEIKGGMRGLQMALFSNQAYDVKGVQLGLINYTRNLQGVQIGILNFCKNQPFKFTLFVNAWNK
jgi:hypothetical protein